MILAVSYYHDKRDGCFGNQGQTGFRYVFFRNIKFSGGNARFENILHIKLSVFSVILCIFIGYFWYRYSCEHTGPQYNIGNGNESFLPTAE